MKKKLVLLLWGFTSSMLYAQTGIGTATPDLSTQLDIVSANKGMLIPRIALISAISPMPISATAAVLPNSLLVYNTTITGDLKAGYYFWGDLKWNKLVTNSEMDNLSAFDGVVRTDNNFSLGGKLAKPVVINTNSQSFAIVGSTANTFSIDGTTLSVDAAADRVGIGTTAPKGKLHVVGDVFIEGAQTLAGAKAMVIDNTGKIGTAANIPSKVLFVQSESETIFSTAAQIASINAGTSIVVGWNTSEIVTNNIVDFDASTNSFVIKEDGFYEASGFLNYKPNATAAFEFPASAIPPTNPASKANDPALSEAQKSAYYLTQKSAYDRERTIAAVNLTVQTLSIGQSNWRDFASARIIYTGAAVQDTGITLIVPPAVLNFKKGDKIRMIFKRPLGVGLDHGTGAAPSISIPGGILFTKGLKMIGL